MSEITIKLDVPEELREKLEIAVEKVVSQMIRRVEFSMAEDILSKSELSDKEALKLGNDLKSRVFERHLK